MVDWLNESRRNGFSVGDHSVHKRMRTDRVSHQRGAGSWWSSGYSGLLSWSAWKLRQLAVWSGWKYRGPMGLCAPNRAPARCGRRSGENGSRRKVKDERALRLGGARCSRGRTGLYNPL